MSGPWEQYGAHDGPWKAYAQPAPPPPQPGYGEDIAKTILPGLARGVIGGIGGAADIITGYGGLTQNMNRAAENAGRPERMQSTPQMAQGLLEKLTGPLYTPKTVPGEYANTIAEFAPGAVAGPEGILPRIASAAVPAIASETAGQATKGTSLEAPARAVSGVLAGLGLGLRVNPQGVLGDVKPGVVDLATKARGLGIAIRPGQGAERPFTKMADNVLERLPGTGYGTDKIPTNAQQGEQFTRAVSRTFGEDSPHLTQDVMAGANARIGKVFNDVLARNNVHLHEGLLDNLDTIGTDAADQLLDGAQRDSVMALIQRIKTKANDGGGILTGRQYQTMRSRGGAIDSIANSKDPTVAFYGRQVRRAMDNAFSDQAPPADAAALATARQQFRNFKTVDPLAAKAPTGAISPALLAERVRLNFPDLTTRGAGDLGTLGKIGQAFLKDPPNSGTAERSLVLSLLKNPLKAGAEATALPFSATIGRIMSKAINSRPLKVPDMPAPSLISYTNPYPGLFGSQRRLLSGP